MWKENPFHEVEEQSKRETIELMKQEEHEKKYWFIKRKYFDRLPWETDSAWHDRLTDKDKYDSFFQLEKAKIDKERAERYNELPIQPTLWEKLINGLPVMALDNLLTRVKKAYKAK